MVLAQLPDLLLLDEPDNHLDHPKSVAHSGLRGLPVHSAIGSHDPGVSAAGLGLVKN